MSRLCAFKLGLAKSLTPACRQELAAAVAAEGLRPILARDTPPQLARLLETAWQLRPGQRPTAAQLETELRSIVGHIPSSSPSRAPLHHEQATNGISTGISDSSQLSVVIMFDLHMHYCHKTARHGKFRQEHSGLFAK